MCYLYISAKGKIVLLLFSAGPLDIRIADKYKVSAIIQCFFPAQATGTSLYNVLTKKTEDSNFSGRLPFTWYSSDAQVLKTLDTGYRHSNKHSQHRFLAHLSRRLTGELVVYSCSGVYNIKDLLL